MNWYGSEKEMINELKGILNLKEDEIECSDLEKFKNNYLDKMLYTAVLCENEKLKEKAKFIIRKLCEIAQIYPSSIQKLYSARGRNEIGGFTVPAINLRGLTYDSARAIIRTAKKLQTLAFIFEIARSEIDYTFQRPSEYAIVCLAAALREGFKGPIFLQGDHFQVNLKKYKENPQNEILTLQSLIEEAIKAEFYNIDIDASTLVELEKSSLEEQQFLNAHLSAKFTDYIRKKQPSGVEISVGGEIGEIGGKNSTVEELHAYLNTYNKELEKFGEKINGISKISVQTGTTHGGVVLEDGSIAKVKIDFETLKILSKEAREKFHLAGAVQHGASTLPEEAFDKFTEMETAEIHLATAFQNIIYDSVSFPKDLKTRIYNFLKENFSKERKEEDTEEQFIYKVRKKGFGPFKKEFMTLSEEVRKNISFELEQKFELIFKKLNIENKDEIVLKYIKPKEK